MDEYISIVGSNVFGRIFGEISVEKWNAFVASLRRFYGDYNLRCELPYDIYVLRHQILDKIRAKNRFSNILMFSEHSFNTEILGIIAAQPKNVIENCSEILSKILETESYLLHTKKFRHLINYCSDESFENWLTERDGYEEKKFGKSVMHEKLHCFKKIYKNTPVMHKILKLYDFPGIRVLKIDEHYVSQIKIAAAIKYFKE